MVINQNKKLKFKAQYLKIKKNKKFIISMKNNYIYYKKILIVQKRLNNLKLIMIK